jgi:hypothetical protein
MQLFTVQDLLSAFWSALELTSVLKDEILIAALDSITHPFHDFSVAGMLAAAGCLHFLWINKGLVISGVVRMLHIADWLLGIIKFEKK